MRAPTFLLAVSLAVLAVGCGSDSAASPTSTLPPLDSTASTSASSVDSTAAPSTAVETTAPTPAPVIAAVGDIACDPASENFAGGAGNEVGCHQMATSDLVLNGGYTAFLALGDLQYENGTLDAFTASYDPSFGRVKDITRPAPGNHEYNTEGAAGYYQYFGDLAGDPAKGYYSYDLGSWHLVALNSNCTFVDCAAGSEQEQWLRADLAAHPSACALVYWHHPRFSSGEHGDDTALADLYRAADEGGVDLVLNGHDHHYERFAPQDADGTADATSPREFVVGTGGKNHYAATNPVANSEIIETGTFGVLQLTLRDDGYDWSFVPEAGATFTDAGSQDCA